MKKRGVILLLTVCLAFLIFLRLASATPAVSFVSPTLANGSVLFGTSIFANLSSSSSTDHYSFVDFDNDVLLWYRMDDRNSSGDVIDLSSYSRNGTVQGSLVFNSTSAFGNASHLAGVNQQINFTDSLAFSAGSNWTIGFWAKKLADDNKGVMLGDNTDANNFIQFAGGARVRFRNSLATDYDFTQITTFTKLHHYTFVANGTHFAFYRNGTYIASLAAVTSFNINAVGDGYAGTDLRVRGLLDEVIVFNRSLNSNEVSSLFNATSSQYFKNFTNLNTEKTYRLVGHAVNKSGTKNETAPHEVSLVGGINQITITNPVQYTIVQRHNDSTGELFIYGNYTGVPQSVSARFNGGAWQVVNSAPYFGKFSGWLNATTGNGTLDVKFTTNDSVSASINHVGIGDLFGVGGQSNAEGRGSNAQVLNSSNRFMATVYLQNDTWKPADDPTDLGTASGSVWPLVANYIIQNQSIPVGFVTAATGGTSILGWQKSGLGTDYDILLSQIAEASNGTMRVKTMLFHQGVRDMYVTNGVNGSYIKYKGNLSAMAKGFIADTEIAASIIVAQTGQMTTAAIVTNDSMVDEIRRAQIDSWNENANISAGPLTHDIGPLADQVHVASNEEIRELAQRWWASIGEVIYGVGDGRGPRLNNITIRSTGASNHSLILAFNDSSFPLLIENWNNSVGVKALGWKVEDGNVILDDDNITSAIVLSSNQIEINFTVNVSVSANFSFGLGVNGTVGLNITRDSSLYKLPLEQIYNESIVFDLLDTVLPKSIIKGPANNTYVKLAGQTFNATFSDENDLKNSTLYIWNSSSVVGINVTTIRGKTNSSNLTFTLPRNGAYFWNYLVADNAGNMAFNNSNYTVTFDSTAPDVSLALSGSDKTSLTISVTITEALSGISGSCTSDRGDVSGSGTSQTVTETGLSCGTSYSYTVTCSDVAGNSGSKTESFSTSGCSGGGSFAGGGSGSSSGTRWENTFVENDAELSEKKSVSKSLGRNNRIKLKIGGEVHHVGVRSVSETNATIEVASDVQEAVLNIGDGKKFEVTDDGFYDLEVFLNNITNGKAGIIIHSLSEEVPLEEKVVDKDVVEAIEMEDIQDFFDRRGYATYLIFAGIIILVVIVLVLFYSKIKKQ